MILQLIKKFFESQGYFIVNKQDKPGYCLKTDLLRLLNQQNDSTIFDVGANKGEESAEYLKMFPRSKIHAFEPGNACYAILNRMASKEERFSFYNIGLGDIDEKRLFYESDYTTISSCLSIEKQGDNVTEEKQIILRSLDSFCPENKIDHIELLKIDVQGYDLKVLEGASKMLIESRIKCVVVELPIKSYYKKQASFEEIFVFLKKNDFRFYGIYNLWHGEEGIDHCDGLFIRKNR